MTTEKILQGLNTSLDGIGREDAEERLNIFGPNELRSKKKLGALVLFFSQFKSPIIIILIFAAILSFVLHDKTGATIILVIVFFSGILGFWQESGAANAVEKLIETVETKVEVLRDGKSSKIPLDEVVPGDIIELSAGKTIPGDCLILESNDLFINEAALSGETFPVEKTEGIMPADTPLAKRTNVLFLGTHAISGMAKAVVVKTGKKTEFGKISERLRLKPAETEFEHGIRRFGYLLMEVTLILVIAIFAVNVYFHKPVLSSLMFSLALAVGLTPQLLPAIISINLAHGAKNMAKQKVIVKHLPSIENFGSMDVLCSDKTGTLTDGMVRLNGAFDISGSPSDSVMRHAQINAVFETGFLSPIDQAIRSSAEFDLSAYHKRAEVPYDFLRKRLSVLVEKDNEGLMVTKGALKNILQICTYAETGDGSQVAIASVTNQIQKLFEQFSAEGYRTLGVAYKTMDADKPITKDSETDMTFIGLLTFWDPPKEGILETIKTLNSMGVALKVITGDNTLVAKNIGQQIGLKDAQLMSGPELSAMSDEALMKQVGAVHIFTEVEPNQKERIILALKKIGKVVGYMGDGINDASAIRAADVGISVDSAVDVAKESADIVLLEKDLKVLERGIQEGRKTFANTLKYVFMATSANFGNMFSMAGASLFMPFLPLLPKQILLTNLMTDFPEMTICTDNVDPQSIDRPRRWDIRFIRNFMITFGVLSSVFDFCTFGVLVFLLHASPELFRTGWFVESIVSATLIVLVIRTRRPFYKSRPSKYLIATTLFIIAVTHYIPFSPIAGILGFKPLPWIFVAAMWAIILLYVIGAEITKAIFYRKVDY